MPACPSCGFDYEGAFKFCPECAAPLGVAPRPVEDDGRVAEASPVLQQAREIFQALQAAPALAATDQLLQQAASLHG